MYRVPTILLLLLPLICTPGSAQDQKSVRDWALVYVMSYDNDLEACGPVILEALQKGTSGNDIAVTVLADFTDTAGLQLHVFDNGQRQGYRLKSDNSASERIVRWYLDWVTENIPARHYGLIFLDHGGNLDDMCLDERPGEPGAKKWLSARAMGPILRDWSESIDGTVDLLFLQQCGRGSIDNLYNFRETATAVMASQTTVGAPNTYYTRTLRWLADHRDATGSELAERIMLDDDHFTTYVCVDGKQLSSLPRKIDPVVKTLLACNELRAPREPTVCFGGWERGGETNVDLLDWLEETYDASKIPGSDRAALQRFRRWVEKDLIVGHRKKPEAANQIERWTGLGLYVPIARRVRTRYLDYPLYEDSRLDELWATLYPVPVD